MATTATSSPDAGRAQRRDRCAELEESDLVAAPASGGATADGQGFLIAVPALTVGIFWLASEAARKRGT